VEKVQRQLEKQVSVAFILSLVSGILLLVQGSLRVIRTQWGFELGLGELRRHALASFDFKLLGIVSIILGIMVVLGSLLIKFNRKREGGITVIAFTALSILSGGGYYAALILGLLGGVLAVSEYKQEQTNAAETVSEAAVLEKVRNKCLKAVKKQFSLLWLQ
jgi:hypothetical protein